MLSRVTLILSCLISIHLPIFAEATNPQKLARPNFVFLLVDDLGLGDFGPYGAKFYETPNIDRLADDGMRFDNAYAACTVCSPSRAALLTGRYPARLRMTDWIAGHNYPWAQLSVPNWSLRIDHDRVLLPEALKKGGYHTMFIGKWHLMPIGKPDFKEHYPTNHGFDINIGGREWGQPRGPGRYFSPFNMPNLDDGQPGDFLTDKLTDAALSYLDRTTRDTPFFMYFSYYTIHGPLMCPPALEAKYTAKAATFENIKNEFLNPKRAGMVESLDTSIGRIIDKLEALGIAENTVIILTGDNGGDYDETTAGLKGFKGLSHEGGTRVPLIIKWPGQTSPGSTSNEVVIGTDFYPTILDMAGLPARDEEHLDGINITANLKNQANKIERDSVYWHYPHYHRTKPYGAIRYKNWKLIEFFEDGAMELYDLATDRNESNNLVHSQPEIASDLLNKLKAWRRSVDAQMMTPNPNFDATKAHIKQRKAKAIKR